jgi:hypothetical protein
MPTRAITFDNPINRSNKASTPESKKSKCLIRGAVLARYFGVDEVVLGDPTRRSGPVVDPAYAHRYQLCCGAT